MLYINSNNLRNKIFKTFYLEPFPVSLKREMRIEKILFIQHPTFSKSLVIWVKYLALHAIFCYICRNKTNNSV